MTSEAEGSDEESDYSNKRTKSEDFDRSSSTGTLPATDHQPPPSEEILPPSVATPVLDSLLEKGSSAHLFAPLNPSAKCEWLFSHFVLWFIWYSFARLWPPAAGVQLLIQPFSTPLQWSRTAFRRTRHPHPHRHRSRSIRTPHAFNMLKVPFSRQIVFLAISFKTIRFKWKSTNPKFACLLAQAYIAIVAVQ